MNFFFKILCLVLVFYGVERFCHRQTEGFTISNIRSNLRDNDRWQINQDPQNFYEVSSKRFYYETKGAQCYVFVSEDQSTVLKFVKQQQFRLPLFFTYLPLPSSLNQRLIDKQMEKQEAQEADLRSYQLAFEEMRIDTGLIYLHLGKTQHLRGLLRIVDKLGIEHQIDPNIFQFIIQKRATLVRDKIDYLMEKGELEPAKEALNSLISLVFHHIEKGIYDADPNLSKNFGFLGQAAIEIDIGRFSKNQNLKECLKPLLYKAEDFQHWLNRKHPQLSDYFQQQFQNRMQKLDTYGKISSIS